jgi:hypothetical protein
MSTTNPTTRLRAALRLRAASVPKIAAKHGVKVPTLYAALYGTRSVRTARLRAVVAEIARIAAEELG